MPDYAIYADDRETLKAHLRLLSNIGKRGVPLIKIVLPCCGERRVYQDWLDIPVNSIGPCSCGNWFIGYREQPFKVLD